jgi:succinoglycan biosynthesis protein ExoM
VLATIESVAKQQLPANTAMRIFVVDNDSQETARAVVEEFAKRTRNRVDYEHVPGQNISIARNAGLDAATTAWLAFIDDDEHAAPDWLTKLLAANSGANAVFGPCEAVYGATTPVWIKRGDYHSNRIVRSMQPIVTGYTSNALIDMNFVRRHGLRFEPALGRTGGEDSMFFHAMYRQGGVLKYASDAIAYERVVPERTNIKWIVRRRYRAGQIYAMMFDRYDHASYFRACGAAGFKIAACAVMFLLTAPNRSYAMWWLMRGVLHCGVLSYAFGANVHQEYSTPTTCAGSSTAPHCASCPEQ